MKRLNNKKLKNMMKLLAYIRPVKSRIKHNPNNLIPLNVGTI
jgi:hypothetical protein